MENETNAAVEPEEEPTLLSGLKQIGFSLLIFGIAYYFYITMTGYENGEGVTMNRLLLLAYGILGKSITTGILGFVGLIVAYSGVDDILKSRASESN